MVVMQHRYKKCCPEGFTCLKVIKSMRTRLRM